MNKNPSRGIYIPTRSKVHPIYEKGHPYYENVHPFYEKRTSQLRVKDIFTTSKEVKKCLNFSSCGAYFFQVNYIFPKLLRKISKFSPNLYLFNLIIVFNAQYKKYYAKISNATWEQFSHQPWKMTDSWQTA